MDLDVIPCGDDAVDLGVVQHVTHHGHAAPRGIWKVIGASSAGTLIEWYDFYIFGSLATIISTQFFPKGNPTVAFLSTLAVFATGLLSNVLNPKPGLFVVAWFKAAPWKA